MSVSTSLVLHNTGKRRKRGGEYGMNEVPAEYWIIGLLEDFMPRRIGRIAAGMGGRAGCFLEEA